MKTNIHPAIGAGLVIVMMLIAGFIGYRAVNPPSDLGDVPQQYLNRGQKPSPEERASRAAEHAQARPSNIAR